jgi:hypothetical protein
MLRTCNRSCRRREGDSIRGPLNYHAGDYAGRGKVQGRVVVTVAGGSDSQNVVGGACGKAQGLGGGMVSTTAAVRNDVPSANRSAMVVFFARMDAVVWQWGGGSCDNGRNSSRGNVVVLTETRAGV